MSELGLKSTQEITRFLRNKKTSIEQIYNVSVGLIRDDSALYLPQKEKFIFELLCDRLSQKNLGDFKKSPQVWDLFKLTWQKFDSDKDSTHLREIVLQKAYLSSIIASSLDQICSAEAYKDTKLLVSFCSCIQLALDDGGLSFSQDQSVTVIEKLMDCVIGCDYDPEVTALASLIVCLIYSQCNSAALRYNKKTVTVFSGSCLPNIVVLRSKVNSRDKIDSVIDDLLFSKDNLPNSKDNLAFFINNARAQNRVTPEDLQYLFGKVIPKVSLQDTEEIFRFFTQRFPEASSLLLKEVVKSNVTLSTFVLSDVVEKALSQLAEDRELSYDIIVQSLSKNTQVGIKFSRRIMMQLLADEPDELANKVQESVFRSYDGARELQKFVALWESLISQDTKQSSVFTSDRFVSFASSHFVALPYVQLERLLDELLVRFRDHEQSCLFPIYSITIGLIDVISGNHPSSTNVTLVSAVEKLKPTYSNFAKVALHRVSEDSTWRLLSYIFTLYDVEEISSEEVDVSVIFKELKSQKNSQNYFFTIFRILEQDLSYLKDKMPHYFVKLVSKSQSSELVMAAFLRWCVLLNRILSSEDVAKLAKLLLAMDNETLVVSILSNPVLHEQEKLVDGIVTALTEALKKGKDFVVPLLRGTLPVYCYSKPQRDTMLDALVKFASSPKHSDDLLISSRQTILDLLELPGSHSSLEKVPQSLFKLVTFSTSQAMSAISLQIVSRVCSEHLKQSPEFIDKLTEELDGGLEASDDNLFSYLSISLCIAECYKERGEKSAKLDSLLSKAAQMCTHLLSKDSVSSAAQLLAKLSKLSPDCLDAGMLKKDIKKCGSKYTSLEVQTSLFSLVCSLGKAYEPFYVAALFIDLEKSPASVSSVEEYLSALADDHTTFQKLWDSILSSAGNSEAYIPLFAALFGAMKKDEEAAEVYQSLVVRSISFALSLDYNKYLLDNMTSYVVAVKKVITNQHWSLSQYSVELIIALADNIAGALLLHEKEVTDPVSLYVQTAQMLSAVLMVQRVRLSNRYHLMVVAISRLMELDFVRGNESRISLSKDCGAAFERLMGNFCDPPTVISRSTAENQVVDASSTMVSSKIRAYLRRSLPVIVFHYLRFFLEYQIKPEMKEYLTNSIFSILGVLTENEMGYINASVDSGSRGAFKNVYEEYLKFGKWKED